MSTQIIRRTLIASSLVLGTAFAIAPAAFATDVTVGGTVSSTLAIDGTITGKSDLDLSASQTDAVVKVATFNMGTNNSEGLTLTITQSGRSASTDFKLARTSGADNTPILFKAAVVAGGASAPTPAGQVGYTFNTGAAAPPASTPYDLYIKYSTASVQDAGAYDGTLTLSVADN